MTVSFAQQDDTTWAAANTAHAQFTMPAGIPNNDLLLAWFGASKGGQDVITAPTNATWTADTSGLVTGSNSSDIGGFAYHKLSATTDSGVTYNWQFTPNADITAAMVQYTGINATTPYNASNASASTLNLSVSTSIPNCLLVYLLAFHPGATPVTVSAAPSINGTPMTQRVTGSATSYSAIYIWDGLLATAGASGTVGATLSGAANAVAAIVALAPAGVTAQVLPVSVRVLSQAVKRAASW